MKKTFANFDEVLIKYIILYSLNMALYFIYIRMLLYSPYIIHYMLIMLISCNPERITVSFICSVQFRGSICTGGDTIFPFRKISDYYFPQFWFQLFAMYECLITIKLIIYINNKETIYITIFLYFFPYFFRNWKIKF